MEAIDIVTVHEVVKEKVNLLNRNMKKNFEKILIGCLE